MTDSGTGWLLGHVVDTRLGGLPPITAGCGSSPSPASCDPVPVERNSMPGGSLSAEVLSRFRRRFSSFSSH